MKIINENLGLISLTISLISLIFVGLTYFITHKTYNAQLKQIQNQELPNLRILSVESFKSQYNLSDSVYDGKYCRIFNGDASTVNISLNENIAVYDANDPNTKIEGGFIDEVKSHIGDNNAYFTYFGAKPYLILNHASNSDRFIIDHSNVKLTFHNYGTKISALAIKEIVVYYKSEMNTEPITFYGDDKNKISLSPDENDKFILYLDEVTTDLNNSLCQMSVSTYINSPESFDLLRAHMVTNRLNYDKLEVKFCCWDMFNNETLLKINFEYNGNFFVSSTTILKN